MLTRLSWRRSVALFCLLLASLGATFGAASLRRFVGTVVLPPVDALDLPTAFFDTRPLVVTTTVSWIRVHEVVEADRVRFDHTLWRRMFVGDWDLLPADIRERGVGAMLQRHGALLASRTAGGRCRPPTGT